VIKKPMDLGTIRDKMDKKDGQGYQTPEQVAADIRLVFRQVKRR
jgi:tripartite motif-containing protein 33